MGVKEDFTSWYYYNGKCYGWMDSKRSWASSESVCLSLGGHLTKMESQADWSSIIGPDQPRY